MKLIPFEYEDWPKDTFRYWESTNHEDDDYYYEVYAKTEDGERVNVDITRFGVSLTFADRTMLTNIEPETLFPDRINSLEWEHIKKILLLIIKGKAMAKTYPQEVVDEWYQEWKNLGRP